MLMLLDIDGVMVTTPPWRKAELLADGFSDFNETSVNSLNRILSETNAGIIITSSHKSRFAVSEWITIFKTRGINPITLETLTPNIFHLSRRGEILHWISLGNENKQFVIIDDDKSLNDLPGHLKNKCVMTDSLIGLDQAGAANAVSILKSSN
ncbi:MAG TPA: HAD domain-containing protein [Flavobacteriales bacterium]|nr:HAD domain-containing protein [Flavobacteriales bacterium]